MKILVVGGITVKSGAPEENSQIGILNNAMSPCGIELSRRGHEILVCSPFPDAADYYVLNGISKSIADGTVSQASVSIYYPDTPLTFDKIKEISTTLGSAEFRKYPCPPPSGPESLEATQYSWLLAQLTALDASGAVIAIGGRPSGSLSLLLHLADARGKAVIPLTVLGGTALDYYNAHFWHLKDQLAEGLSVLAEIDFAPRLNEIMDSILIGKGPKGQGTFFISYARARPSEADYVETLLRRRNFTVFRDEKDFEPAADTQADIIKNIKKADVFIAIWCKEYACSPWCADELEMAINRHADEKTALWIFCVDDTRIVPKQARSLNYYRVKSREELEGKLLELLIRLKRKK